MAIAKIKKIELIGLNKDKDNLLDLLQKTGLVQLINIQQSGLEIPKIIPEDSRLLELEEAISYLAGFQEKTGFLENIISPKPVVCQEGLKEVMHNFSWQEFLKGLGQARNHLKTLQQQQEKLQQESQLLAPWGNLSLPLDRLHPTRKCDILLGVMRFADYAQLLENCKKEKLNLFSEVVSQEKANAYPAIIYLQEDFAALEAILKEHRFIFVTLSRHKLTASERLKQIHQEITSLEAQIKESKEKIFAFSQERLKLMVVYDYLANQKKIKEADSHLASQQYAFSLSGWIRSKDIVRLEKSVSGKFKEVAIFISQAKDEEVPVDLENKGLLEPFEFITKIYGMPQYQELDPTPFLAPFFFLYFGFCVSDAGYGIMLALLSLFALKKFKMGPQGKRFWKLFFFCGISTIIVGVLTGSWFGNALDIASEGNNFFLPLKKFKDSLVLLDPLKQPTKLLAIALSLGIIQVWFGSIVAAIGNLKNRRYLDIFLDQVPILTFLFGLTGLGMAFLGLLANFKTGLFKHATLLSALILILTQGRSEKGVAAKLFYGVYNLYNAFSGYLSDVLSYSRLWALGLVTGVMANTVNLISVQFSQIVVTTLPFLSRVSFIRVIVTTLVFAIIFIAGHTVSFLMNLLGAFVHPLRLQFVEFFSKFFKPGGKPFRPFKVETRYINIG